MGQPGRRGPWGPESLQAIEFPKVLARAAALAETPMGHDAILQLTPLSGDEVKEMQARVRDALRAVSEGRLGLNGAAAIADMAVRAKKGGVLSLLELVRLSQTLAVAQRVASVLTGGAGRSQGEFPALTRLWEAVTVPQEFDHRLRQCLSEDASVRDQASSRLAEIRRAIRQINGEIDQIFDRLLTSPQWAPYLQEPVVTLRFGRRVVPVKREFRHSVAGIVQDESASGQTVFVEPSAVVQRQNRLAGLQRQEDAEIERIIAELSRWAGSEADRLVHIHGALTALDVSLAMARYGQALRGILPALGGARLILEEARHPLLDDPVPIGLQLEETRRLLIITGPNTGGKTVALKTVGLMAAMAWSGMMVPCQEAEIPMLTRIIADIGDEQSLEQNLSTFSSHLARLIPMMAEADDKSLCLIDEIGAGTDPEEGVALAEAMVERLVLRRAYAVVTTHFTRLKLLAFKNPAIQNAQVEFDRDTLSPTYHLVMGQPGGSHALFIARRLGMDEELVARAESLMDAEGVALAEAIWEVNAIQKTLRQKEAALADEQRRLARLRDELERERERLDKERAEFRAQAREGWRREFERVKQEVDQALRQIQAQAAEERARALEEFRRQFRDWQRLPPALAEADRKSHRRPQVGERVKVAGFSELGVVTALNGETATVEVGALRLKLAVSDLEPAGKSDLPRKFPARARRPSSAFSHKAVALAMECDVRGQTAADALEIVDKYLDDAVLAGAPWVRIIHGKGTGVLRRAIAEALRRDPRVVRYRLGSAQEGGDGATIVHLQEGLDVE